MEINCEESKKTHEEQKRQRKELIEKKAAEREQDIKSSQDVEKKALSEMLTNEYGNKTTCFYGKEDIFSNFYPCQMEVEGVTYNCTEQYLVAERVREVCKEDAEETLKDIMNETNPVQIKRKGRKWAPWKDSTEHWQRFAEQKLEVANEAKYSQHPDLRVALFGTSGTRLVEASRDLYWGVWLDEGRFRGIRTR